MCPYFTHYNRCSVWCCPQCRRGFLQYTETGGYYVEPTVFDGVDNGMRIAQEEIFGPVVTLMAYDSLDQAIDMANDTEYGLSAAISGDPAKAAPVATKLRAGMVAINNWGPTPGAPFGGYKQSGNGREGGLAGLKDFMEMKAISGLPA